MPNSTLSRHGEVRLSAILRMRYLFPMVLWADTLHHEFMAWAAERHQRSRHALHRQGEDHDPEHNCVRDSLHVASLVGQFSFVQPQQGMRLRRKCVLR